ncbi:MAG: PKD domain-containing protein [Crocinitomix sp.]|nr:PKD domain-containing protein [Crocinitomix sp.]
MKIFFQRTFLNSCLLLTLFVLTKSNAIAQVDCAPIVCLSPVTAPATIDGVSVTDAFTGGVTYYALEFVSCMDSAYRTPADSRHIGTGPFTYTLNFSEPVNGVCFILTATGQFLDEVFTITTDAGIPTIGNEGSCFTSIAGNVISTGAAADGLFDCAADPVFAGGGGGMFSVTNPGGPYSSFTISGPGGEGGSLFALCSLCPIIESESYIEHTDETCFGACDGVAEVIDGDLGPYTYQWDPGAGGGTAAIATGLCAGTYTVEVTDVSGSVEVLEVIIISPIEIVGTIIEQIDVSCFGLADGSVTVEAVGGVGALTYDIGDGPVDTGEFIDLVAGLYTITVTDETGCTIEIPVEILEPAELILTEVLATDILCNGGDDGAIEVIGSGGTGPYTYNIDGGLFGDATVFTDLVAGDYTFIVMDDNGCEASIIISLIEPEPIVVAEIITHEVCLGDCIGTINLDGAGGTGAFTYSIDACATTAVLGAFADLCAGDYEICVEDENGCQYTSTLTVNPGATEGDATIIPFGPLCINDDPVTLDAVDIGTFTGPGVVGGVFNPAVAGVGTHTITNTIVDGCGDAATFDVIVTPLPVVTFTVNENAHCSPLEAIFTNTGDVGVSCEWNFGDGATSTVCGGVSHTYDIAGTYDVSLTVTDANGCSNTAVYYDFIEVYELPTANFIFDPLNPSTLDSEVDFTDYSINADAWIWNFGGFGNSTDQNPSFIFPEVEGTYNVTLIAVTVNGCTDTITKSITINQEQLIFVPNAITPDGDTFNEVFKPYFTGIDIYDYHLTIYNRWGEKMFESYNLATGWNGTYGGELVQDGVYIWHITTAEIATDKKLEFHGHVTVVK